MNEQRKEYSMEENVNWISYNLKRIADMLEQMNGCGRPEKKTAGFNRQNSNESSNYNNNQPF